MKTTIPLIFLLMFSSVCSAKRYKCAAHEDWPDDRSFVAEIKIENKDKNIKAVVSELNLSEPWPLPVTCDKPELNAPFEMEGVMQGAQAKFWVENGKECGFMLFLPTEGNNPTLLSPRRNYKVNGEKPYVANCKAF